MFVGVWQGAWSGITAPAFKWRSLLSGCWLMELPQLFHVAPIQVVIQAGFTLVKASLVLPSGEGLGQPQVTQLTHAAACHLAPAIFANQVNQPCRGGPSTLRPLLSFSLFFLSLPWSPVPRVAPDKWQRCCLPAQGWCFRGWPCTDHPAGPPVAQPVAQWSWGHLLLQAKGKLRGTN